LHPSSSIPTNPPKNACAKKLVTPDRSPREMIPLIGQITRPRPRVGSQSDRSAGDAHHSAEDICISHPCNNIPSPLFKALVVRLGLHIQYKFAADSLCNLPFYINIFIRSFISCIFHLLPDSTAAVFGVLVHDRFTLIRSTYRLLVRYVDLFDNFRGHVCRRSSDLGIRSSSRPHSSTLHRTSSNPSNTRCPGARNSRPLTNPKHQLPRRNNRYPWRTTRIKSVAVSNTDSGCSS